MSLEAEGFVVREIDRSSDKTPDFIVNDETETYVLELKQKQSTPREGEKFRKFERHGRDIYVTRDSTGRRNRLAAIVEKAVSQLSTVELPCEPLKLVWFLGEGPDAALHEEQLVATLYGIKDVIWRPDDESEVVAAKCLYADYSAFDKYKAQLDGVIASNSKSALFYLNNRSARYDRLRSGRLARTFGSSVFDPIEQEAAQQVLMLDPFDETPDESDLREAVKRKYGGIVVALANFTRHYAETHVPKRSRDEG